MKIGTWMAHSLHAKIVRDDWGITNLFFLVWQVDKVNIWGTLFSTLRTREAGCQPTTQPQYKHLVLFSSFCFQNPLSVLLRCASKVIWWKSVWSTQHSFMFFKLIWFNFIFTLHSATEKVPKFLLTLHCNPINLNSITLTYAIQGDSILTEVRFASTNVCPGSLSFAKIEITMKLPMAYQSYLKTKKNSF